MLTNIACPPPSPLNPSQSSPSPPDPKDGKDEKRVDHYHHLPLLLNIIIINTIIIKYYYYYLLLLSTIIIIIRPMIKCHPFMKIINSSEQIFWILSIWLKYDGSRFFQVQWCLSLCFSCTRFLQACLKVVWTFAPLRQMLLVEYSFWPKTQTQCFWWNILFDESNQYFSFRAPQGTSIRLQCH